jgi:hypothetical protein
MMTRYSALLVLLALSTNVEAELFSKTKRSLRERTRNRNRDGDVSDPVEEEADVVPETTPGQGRGNSRPGRNYRDASQGEKKKVEFSPPDGTVDFAPGPDIPAMEEGGEPGEVSFAPGPGMAGIPEDDIDRPPADLDEMPADEIPSMEAETPQVEVNAAAPGGERGPPPVDDEQDEPTIDGDEMPKDGPPGAEMAPMEVEAPQMEVNAAAQSGQGGPPDKIDEPTDVDEGDEMPQDKPEIAVMEHAPGMEVSAAAAQGGQGGPPDKIDEPTDVDEGDEMPQDEPEIAVMEHAPGMEVSAAAAQGGQDQVDLPNDLDDPEDGFVEVPPMEEIPLILPFGDQAEGYILGHTVSVCATGLDAARIKCEVPNPICKFKRNSENIITSEMQPNQPSDCVRRCDFPLGLEQCESHEECYNFVFNCDCAPFEFDGGRCQPY